MKIRKRIPSGNLSRVAAVDSMLSGLAAISCDTSRPTRPGRFHLGRWIAAESGRPVTWIFHLADGSRLELAAEEMATLVGTWNAREADRRELAARHDAADAADRQEAARREAAAGLARIAASPDVLRYASPAAQAEADAAAVAAAVPAPSPVAWQPDPRCLGGYLANFGRDGWRYSVRPLGKRGGYALATFDGYGVASASLAEYATLAEAQAAAEGHAGGEWPARAGIRWEAAGGSRSARIADVPGGRLSVQRTELHARSFRASINGEHVGTRTSCQAAMAAAVAEYMRRRQGPDKLRDAPGRVA